MPWPKGKKCPEEVKEKIRNSTKGRKRPPFSSEWRKHLSEAQIGRKLTEEHRRKISEKNKGRKPYLITEEIRNKISQVRKIKPTRYWLGKKRLDMTGENCLWWKGGISKQEGYQTEKKRRREIRKRGNGGSHSLREWESLKNIYNFTCPCCGKQEPEIQLTRDHIIPLSKGGSDNLDNIQPLCRVCNSRKLVNSTKYPPFTETLIKALGKEFHAVMHP